MEVIKIEQIEDVQGVKYLLFTLAGPAAVDSISNCAIMIGPRREIDLGNKKITVNLL